MHIGAQMGIDIDHVEAIVKQAIADSEAEPIPPPTPTPA